MYVFHIYEIILMKLRDDCKIILSGETTAAVADNYAFLIKPFGIER